MATISSPKAKLNRLVNLAIFEDGSWKIISDLEPATIKSVLEEKLAEVNAVLDRRTAGETEDDEDDESDEQPPAVPSVTEYPRPTGGI